MKVSKEQVAEHRARILAAAARLFRLRGFEDVTVAEVMKDAGLTHGAFYGHFSSKEALIAEAIGQALAPAPEDRKTRTPAAAYADGYLSAEHRDDRATGCSFSSLGTEAARGSVDLRRVMTESTRRQIDRFSAEAERRLGAREAARSDRRVVSDGRRDGACPHCRRRQAVQGNPGRDARVAAVRLGERRSRTVAPTGAGSTSGAPFSSSGKPGDPR